MIKIKEHILQLMEENIKICKILGILEDEDVDDVGVAVDIK